MAVAELADVSLYYEVYGEGPPIIWCHEYFGDYRSWAPQLTAFSRRYRNIVYSARGYFRSSAPNDASQYSQDLMIEDVGALLDHLGIDRAIVAGLSMGANVALNFGLRHPDRCLALVVAGCGSGSTDRELFEEKANAMIARIEAEGPAGLSSFTATDDTRADFAKKDPSGLSELCRRILDREGPAAAHVYREVQLRRPGIFSLTDQMARCPVPTLVIFGDRDRACVEPGIHIWRSMQDAQLAVFPATGHCVNLEEPALFNDVVGPFFAAITAT